MEKNLLGNDLVINENDCNLSCQYCLTGQSNLKKSHEEQLIFKRPHRDIYQKSNILGMKLNRIVQRMKNNFSVPLLKITGGEVFLIKDMLDFIEQMSQKNIVVIVQTNGVLLLDKQIDRLQSLKNLVLQISLDSHLHTGNSYRIAKKSLHEKVVRKIEKVLHSNIPVEIYSVINNRSIDDMPLFIEWLHQMPGIIKYYPFPVRGPEIKQYAITKSQINIIKNIIAHYDDYRHVFPPRAYFSRLLDFYQQGERKFRCHLPRLVISSFSDGMVTACPNIWFSDLGSALKTEQEWQTVTKKVGNNGLYQALLADKPRLKACKGCFTPWDTLSMYFDNEISLDELCEAPTYAFPHIKEFILQRKKEFDAMAENSSHAK